MTPIENMYRIARDPRYSDTHRDLAARAITRAGRPAGVSPHARMLIRRTISFEYELTSDHYTDDTNAEAAELERKMSIYEWFRQTDFDSAEEISFEVVWEDDQPAQAICRSCGFAAHRPEDLIDGQCPRWAVGDE